MSAGNRQGEPLLHCREQIASAIVWELIWQMMRRYHVSADMRVWETHPGGGQYDCLTLCPPSRSFSYDFNLQAQSLHVWKGKERVARLDIVNDYLRCGDPKKFLDRISAMAGLPGIDRLPPSDAQVIACGLVACLFRMRIFSLSRLKILMAYCDSSGFGGIRRKELSTFREYLEASAGIDIDRLTEENAELVYRYFFLEDVTKRKIPCLIDMASGRIALRDGDSLCLQKEHGKFGRDMEAFAASIARRIGL